MTGAVVVNALALGGVLALLLRLRGALTLVPVLLVALWELLPLVWTPSAVLVAAGGTGSFSSTAALLSAMALAPRAGVGTWIAPPECRALALAVVVSGTALLAARLGLPGLEGLYGTGFGDFRLSTLLLLAGLAAWVLRAWSLCVLLAAGQLAFGFELLPAGNLWDYLLDPFLWVWALGYSMISTSWAWSPRSVVRTR